MLVDSACTTTDKMRFDSTTQLRLTQGSLASHRPALFLQELGEFVCMRRGLNIDLDALATTGLLI